MMKTDLPRIISSLAAVPAGLCCIARRLSFLSSLVLLCFAIPSGATAQPARGLWSTYNVKTVISDGSNGRVWQRWSQNISERPVRSVIVTLERRSGSNDTFVNLRFGLNGQTFENGRRVYLRDNSRQSITWNVNGEAPGGRPLVLNAYKGEVYVDHVRVEFADAEQPVSNVRPIVKPPRPRPLTVDSGSSGADAATVRRCERRDNMRPPRIEITRVKPTGDLFSGKYRIEGSITAACVEEAGYYERGRLKDKIDIPLASNFQRQDFKLTVRTGKSGEIRVLTVTGDEASEYVDDAIRDYSSDSLF